MFLATQLLIAQYILDTLSEFCAQNLLIVSIKETKWLFGGFRYGGFTIELDTLEDQVLTYRGTFLKQVDRFKHLGLEYMGHPGMATMVETWLVKAKQAWIVLYGKLISLRWRDKSTSLALFEAYVQSVILYGCSLWGVTKLDGRCRVGVDSFGN